MPIDEPVRVRGVLQKKAAATIIDVDGGGFWLLADCSDVHRLIGCRVEVEGTRSGFNELSCTHIWRQGEPRPVRGKAGIAIEFAFVTVLLATGLISCVASILK